MITLRMKAENAHSEESVSEATSSLAEIQNRNTRHSAVHVKANLMHPRNVFLSFRNGYCRPMKAVFSIANLPFNCLYRYKTLFSAEKIVGPLL